MTTAAMKRMNTHGTTTLAGAASGRGLLLPMPDTTTTTTHSLGGTPVGVVAVGTIAFYPSGGKCTPSRVRYEKRNPEVVLRNEYFRRVCRGFEVSCVPSVSRGWFFFYFSSLLLLFVNIQFLFWRSNSSLHPYCFGFCHSRPWSCCLLQKATPQSGRRRCSTTTGKLLDVHAMFQALPPIGLHLSADVLEQTNGAALHVTPPQRRVVFCSRCQAIDGQRADRLCRYPNDDLASGHLLLLGFPAPSPNPTAH